MKSIGNGKAAEFMRKVAAALRGKAAVLRARLVFLVSPRRRAAVVAGISRHIRALTPRHHQGKEKPAAPCRGGVTLAPPADEERVAVDLSKLVRLFQQVDDEDGRHTEDWALNSLFDDEHGHRADGDDGLVVVAAAAMDDRGFDDEDEPPSSVIDVIRRRREGDRREFSIEDDIDQAADMYIARVRRRLSAQAAKGAFD